MLSASATPGGAPSLTLTATGASPTGQVPTDITLAPSSLAEGSPTGSTVGTLSTTDADAADTHTYSLVGGAGSTDNAAFTIMGNMVRTAGVLDFETKSSYSIRVRTLDSGSQIFEKALTIDVTNVDEAPSAINDNATVVEDSGATAIDVLANDTDVDGGPKMIVSITQPANGSVIVTGGGTGLTYQPSANYFGGDTFTYTLNGGSLGTVSLTVTGVDDAPVAVNDTSTVAEDAPATAIDVLANDTDIDGGPLSVSAVTQGAHGTVAITGGGTGLTYQPAANYTGADSFTYTVNGGSTATVAITVTAVDDPPVAVNDSVSTLEDTDVGFDPLVNDTDVDGGAKTVISLTQPTHGTATQIATGILYHPNMDYFGPDSFTYTLNGGSVGTVTVDVISQPDAPVLAVSNAASYTENAAAVAVDPNITVVDQDSTDLVSATIAITTGFQATADELAFTPAAGITGTYNATTGVLSLTGTATLAQYQTALRSVTYRSTSENPRRCSAPSRSRSTTAWRSRTC